MLIGLSVFLIILGIFFLSLGMLFLKYEFSPLKHIVSEDAIEHSTKLGIQIIAPALVLFWLALKVLSTR